jgi:hypothetical protein
MGAAMSMTWITEGPRMRFDWCDAGHFEPGSGFSAPVRERRDLMLNHLCPMDQSARASCERWRGSVALIAVA